MKRGLKDKRHNTDDVTILGSNLCPDEKGTESLESEAKILRQRGSNLCPDEKGTERSRWMLATFAVGV